MRVLARWDANHPDWYGSSPEDRQRVMDWAAAVGVPDPKWVYVAEAVADGDGMLRVDRVVRDERGVPQPDPHDPVALLTTEEWYPITRWPLPAVARTP